MKRIATAVLLIPCVLLLVLTAPFWPMAMATAMIGLLAAREYLLMVEAYQIQPFKLFTYLMISLLILAPALATSNGFGFFWLFFVALLLLLLLQSLLEKDLGRVLPGISTSVFGCLYIGVPLLCLVYARGSAPQGWFAVLFILIVVWSGDTFAYYVGSTIGRRLLAPRISPKKTWEGAIASLLGSMLAGFLLFTYGNAFAQAMQRAGWPHFSLAPFSPPRLLVQFALSALVNLAAQIGDLVESLMKRGANMKDSGNVLPGHGGVLDRIDALLLAAPFAMLVSSQTATFNLLNIMSKP